MSRAALAALALLAVAPSRAEEPLAPASEQASDAARHRPIEDDLGDPRAPSRTVPPSRRSFVIPVLSYLPETGLGGGASAGMHLHVEGAPRPTSLFATALYTTERQGLLDLAVDSVLRDGTVLGARARALHYPDRFYGIGRSTRSSAMEHFTRRSIELVTSAEVPLPWIPGVRLGPRIDLRAEEITDKDAGGQLETGRIPGANGSSSLAAGLSATWDTRQGTFWPSSGSLVQCWFVAAPEVTSRNGDFWRSVLELRHFLPLGGDRVLGLHAYWERAAGEVPFTLLPRLGNTRFLRGIREGRYRDGAEWAVQSEFRTPLWWRLSGVAFAALGDVAPRLNAVRLDAPKVAGGLGLRYRLTDEGANVRVDVAASRFGVQLYVLVLEAF